MSDLPDLGVFANRLTTRSVEHREVPFRLRGGGLSHWYVDLRYGLCGRADLEDAGRLLRAAFELKSVTYTAIGGIGVCGRALVPVTAMATGDRTRMSWGNDDRGDTDMLHGYGFHPTVRGERVTLVDDVATTGDSLQTAVEMIRAEGGTVADAAVLVDRSEGRAAAVARQMGVILHTVLRFDEAAGVIIPM